MISWNRVASVLTALTATVHIVLAFGGTTGLASVLLVGMAMWCLVCSKHLWESSSATVCLVAAGGGLAMIGLHLAMMSAPGSAMQMTGHHHHELAAASSGPSMMDVAMVSGIVAEIVLLGLVATAVVRKRRAA